MRIVFFGTPAFAVPTLDAIAASSHELVGVITQPDRARGRGQRITFAPVKTRALALNVPILQPERLKGDEFLSAFDAMQPDLGVVAAYGRILPQILLDRPPRGMINVHASLLPRWRGAAPVHRSILAGDTRTGVTIMRVVLALDAGGMIDHVSLDIDPDETSAALEARLAVAGAHLLADVLSTLGDAAPAEVAQDESLVTYAERLVRADGDVYWARPARTIHNQIRGLHPWPHAAARLGDRRILLIESRVEHERDTTAVPGTVLEAGAAGLVVAAAPGAVRILRLQPEGRPAMTARDFLNGHPLTAGEHLTTPVRPA